MNPIYFDNAATSFPKPSVVATEVANYLTNLGCNINRGGYHLAYKTEEKVLECRELLCDLFHGYDAGNVIFTKNITESLNLILKGFLKPGDHVIVSSMEHNALMRPLVQLEKQGITFTRIQCDKEGRFPLEALSPAIQPNTKMVALLHASNVCGTVLPIAEIGKICKKNHLKFVVDSAQTGGVIPIDMQKMNIDALAFTGHKGLLGPQGIGGFLLTDEMADCMQPLLSGGTGSFSHTEEIPSILPDKFEAGTLNLPGIMGLRASLRWLAERGIDSVSLHESTLTARFINGLQELEVSGRLGIIGLRDSSPDLHTGVVSIQPLHMDPAALAYELDSDYSIMTRVGLHCAPSAHKTLGTFPTGTIRFSFGWANTAEEVDYTLDVLNRLLKE